MNNCGSIFSCTLLSCNDITVDGGEDRLLDKQDKQDNSQPVGYLQLLGVYLLSEDHDYT